MYVFKFLPVTLDHMSGMLKEAIPCHHEASGHAARHGVWPNDAASIGVDMEGGTPANERVICVSHYAELEMRRAA
jgi:hypothetical protein